MQSKLIILIICMRNQATEIGKMVSDKLYEK